MFKKLILPQVSEGDDKRQRGQVVLLYALFMPILFLLVGLTFDLGWYYLNVSRMQNAADAAVIAGAQSLIDENQSLSDYSATSFINDIDIKNSSESSRDTSDGDKVAKVYVGKNIAQDDSNWSGNSIIDLWTKSDVYFTSELLGDTRDNLETLYYHVQLEEEVPHMLLGSFVPMNAKVSAIAKITRYMKGYDLFEQMINLEKKQTYLGLEDFYDKKASYFFGFDSAAYQATLDHSILSWLENNLDHRREEILNLSNEYNDSDSEFSENNSSNDKLIKQMLDNLIMGAYYDFAGIEPNTPSKVSAINRKLYRIHRLINIDTVYPVRDYDFYASNEEVLQRLREENPDDEDLTDRELAQKFAKEPPDPLYVRIESEPRKGTVNQRSVRQVIINVNVSNTDDLTERPIIFFYDGPEYDESLPVILNLNADFRGVLFAPNSPVAINGNNHDFTGFVVADRFVQLMTEDDDYSDEYYEIIDEHGNVMLVDSNGDVQYKETFSRFYRDFNIAHSFFDSFNIVAFDMKDNLLRREDFER